MLDVVLEYLPSWIRTLNSFIDYEGQRKSERFFQVILIVHGVLGFFAGYLTQQLSVTMYSVGVGFLISCLIVLPPWPFYRQNPLNWQPNSPVEEDKAANPSSSSGNKNSKKTLFLKLAVSGAVYSVQIQKVLMTSL
ncbi:hypothetical protein niasHS_003598 [Heterodera schachtii]|uniref:Signal peptidase complex subunit 1 n=1 Tax=Heterodera schachtii TaxID=97005 RepID=A0ABD2KIB5_HETSC